VGPRYSVVIPTAGRPSYLERCLASLAGVDPPGGGFEVVVVNDGGGKATERVVANAPPSLNARVAPADGTGPSAARNTGAAAAQGSFIAFTDDDCEPRPEWLVALGRALEANPGAAVGGTTVNGAPDDPGAVASQIVVDALHARFNRDPKLPRFFASSNIAVPREEFRAVGGFDPRYRYAEDREFCERWIRSGRRFAGAPDAIVDHMRTLSARQFVRQHHGYGRGAWAFRRARESGGGDTAGVLRQMAREGRRASAGRGSVRVAAYLTLSQLATASGYAREAVAELGRRG
jgi:GT2 family glycosyltransferase